MRHQASEAVLNIPGGRLRSFARVPADWYTVLTYDRRGLSGSAPSAPAEGHNLQIGQPELFAALTSEWLDRVATESWVGRPDTGSA